ncbi:MAG: tRNA isopentenyl-2-thiomethyl-A-37 hydroxylase MiaE, partial [Gammaproteobacteria bacterium]
MEVPLHWSTPPAWAELALEQPQALLSDHAHCELGAAASAQSMLLRRPGDARLVESMG